MTPRGVETTRGRTVAGLDAIPLEDRARLLSLRSNPLSFRDALEGSIWSNVETGLEVLRRIFGAILLLGLSTTLSYALLERDDEISERLVALAGGRDTTVHAYARAVDEDLESVFFGNLLFVIAMGVVATVTYAATNLVAPTGLRVPIVLVLGFLTGLTSIIPIVVGKVVYLPVVALLGFQAMAADGNHLSFVGGVLLVYFLVLDFLRMDTTMDVRQSTDELLGTTTPSDPATYLELLIETSERRTPTTPASASGTASSGRSR